MAVDSIAATGAKPGDRVKCVKDRDNHPRFIVGKSYPVVASGASVGCFGEKLSPDTRALPPFSGFGYEWELVA